MSVPQLTCVSCQVIFFNNEIHRTHYKSDWHCYNLKRKLASLPPVTFEVFQQRIADQSRQLSQGKTSQYCGICHKNFSSINAFENHLKSRRHLDSENRKDNDVQKMNAKNLEKAAEKIKIEDTILKSVVAVEDPNKIEDDDSDSSWEDVDDETVDEKQNVESTNGNEKEEGSQEEIYFDSKQCLFCTNVGSDIENNVHHMSLIHSFFVPDVEYLTDLNGLLTYLGEKVYIDFMCLWCSDKGRHFHSSKATQQHMIDKGHCKMLHEHSNIYEYADFYDYRTSYPDHAENADDEEVTPLNLSDEAWELVLPSGAHIGHRSLARYFKQSFPPESVKNTALPKRILSHYKALGWTGTSGVAAIRKARDIRFMQKVKSKFQVQVSVKANKLQRHFRPQVLY